MIIQMNATVCAAVDHGEDRRHKIAVIDGGGELSRAKKSDSDQGSKDFQRCGPNGGPRRCRYEEAVVGHLVGVPGVRDLSHRVRGSPAASDLGSPVTAEV